MKRLYTPPEHFYDNPMLYVYDAAALTDGQNYPNQFINCRPGSGDFTLRRVVGLNRVLENDPTLGPGQFQLRDGQGRYLQSLPTSIGTGGKDVLGSNSGQLVTLPETSYLETGAIRFDLFNILRATDQSLNGNDIYSSQVGFHGIGRVPGNKSPYVPTYKFKPKTYTYRCDKFVPYQAYSSGTLPTGAVQAICPIVDYDFELWNIQIVYASALVVTGGESIGTVGFQPVFPLPAGIFANDIRIKITSPVAINQPLTITTTAKTISISLQTNGTGNVITTVQQLINLVAATPAAAALVTAIIINSSPVDIAPDTGGVFEALIGVPTNYNLTQAMTKLMLYDQHLYQVYNEPAIDLFVNENSFYQLGALVPPMLYKKDSQIRMDVYSLLGDSFGAGANIEISYVGRQRIPCQ